MIGLYNTIIYHPILNLLVFLYNLIPGHDIGIVIIVITILIRLLLAPLMNRSLKGQQAMNAIQPKLNELREKHKGDQQGQAAAMMALYKEHNISPFASCLPLLVQLPILIALYQVFRKALSGNLAGLYSFVHNPGAIDPHLFGVLNLAAPSIVLAILSGLAQFWQSRLMLSKTKSTDPTQRMMTYQTMYVLPIISIAVAWRLPAGLPLYWLVSTLFSVAQQYYIIKKHPVSPAIIEVKPNNNQSK